MSRNGGGLAALWGAVLIWASAPLFIRYFRDYYDPHTQNFFRYAFACLGLLVIRMFSRSGRFLPSRSAMVRLLLPMVANVVFQVGNVAALYYIDPGMASFLAKLSAVFAAAFAFVFFQEERTVIRSPRFLIGVCVILLGAAGVSALTVETRGPELAWGVLLALLGAAGWGGYVVAIKHAVRSVTPIFTVSVSRVTFGERMSLAQIGSGIVLLVGAFLAVRARSGERPSAPSAGREKGKKSLD